MTNPTLPQPIGAVHWQFPRAVMVRDPEATGGIHSAVQSPLIIYTETVSEANALIASWSEIIQVVYLKVEEILGRAET